MENVKMQKQAIAMDAYRVLKGYFQQRWMGRFDISVIIANDYQTLFQQNKRSSKGA